MSKSNHIAVPYAKSVHGQEEIDAVNRVLASTTQMGEHTRQFEAQVATLFGKKYGVMVNSGSSANYLAIEMLELPAGSEIITPALTFGTTVAPLIKHNLVPAFVDVEEGTYNINCDLIEEMIGPKTKALMIPDLIGNLSDWGRLKEIADQHNLFLIDDSCDTIGSTFQGNSPGVLADMCITSFYGSHIINCAGNGGMLTTDNEAFADRARLLRSWGRSSSLYIESEAIENRFNVNLEGIEYDAKFVFAEPGYNLEPSEMGAAFGLEQLKRLPGFMQQRESNFAELLEFFSEYEHWFVLPKQRADVRTAWLAFALTLRPDAPFSRREMQIHLEQRNIQTRPVFTGNVLRQPAFKNIEAKTSADGYPVADAVMRGGILLGCHQGMTREMMDYLKETVREFLGGF